MRQFFHAASDSHIGQGSAFVIGDTQYPANWLEHASAEDIAGLGLVEVVTVGQRRDERYFDNAEVMDGATLTITSVSREASAVHAAKWADIKDERDRRKDGGFKMAGKWYHSDGGSKLQHLGNKDTARDQLAAGGSLADLLLDPDTGRQIVWKTMDGSLLPLTCQLAFDIVRAGKAAEFAHHAAAETHKAAMLVSAEPSAYDFSAGWPAIF